MKWAGQAISKPEQADAAWLTNALHRSGALTTGTVTALDAESASGSWSRLVRITPRYSLDASGARPPALLLKICAGEQPLFGDSEVSFYTRDYRGYPLSPLPRCYDAVFEPKSGAYHLLLEDLSATHCDSWGVPKTLQHGYVVAGALARLHAHHWGAERLAESGWQVAADPELEKYFAHVSRGLPPLFDTLGEQLPGAWREALHALTAHHQGLMRARAQNAVGMTLVHGDVNPGNILVPKHGREPCYLIDRQPFDWSLQCWLGASDLAYLMVLFWEPEQRTQCQEPVLRHYQAVLASLGVELSWQQLFWDYRFSVLQCLQQAIEWLIIPEDRVAKRFIWEPQLTRSMNAYFELDCADLFGSVDSGSPE